MIAALLELLLALGELIFSWRFYLCVIIGAALFGAILLFTLSFHYAWSAHSGALRSLWLSVSFGSGAPHESIPA
jgi:formate/nitrite transporter FocA (FNT family)